MSNQIRNMQRQGIGQACNKTRLQGTCPGILYLTDQTIRRHKVLRCNKCGRIEPAKR